MASIFQPQYADDDDHEAHKEPLSTKEPTLCILYVANAKAFVVSGDDTKQH